MSKKQKQAAQTKPITLNQELWNFLCQEFSLEYDNQGQIVFYTGLMMDGDNKVVPFINPDDE